VRALIPAAGVGTRLRPHTHTVPKALLPVAGKPIMGHIVDDLIQAGIDEICFITGYMGDRIREWAQGRYRIPMQWIDQRERLGLGHAVLTAAEAIRGEPVLIVLGDTLFEADLPSVLERPDNSLGVMPVEDPSRFGVVIVEGGKVVRLVEKPAEPISHLAIAGLYLIRDTDLLLSCLQRMVEEERRTRGEYQLTDALAMMMEQGAVFRTFTLEGWYDCGLPETVLETNRHLLERAAAVPGADPPARRPGCIIVPPVHLGEGVVMEHSVVGPWVTLDEGAQIRGSVVQNAIIGRSARVEKAILDGSLIGDHAVVIGRPMSLNVGDSSEINLSSC
jgi:glucose-1-phosphate thymidylyltransferase